MDVKKVALLIGALIVAAVTAVMARSMFSGASTPVAEAAVAPLGPGVLVATKSLPVGTIVDVTAIKFQPWPKDLVQQHYFVEGQPDADPSKLIGTVVRNPITAGQPITQGALVKPGDRGFLAAALGPGMRAISVPVSHTASVAGFIFPGDRVDIMLNQEVSGDGPALKASETIVRNVRVLATDQRVTAENAEGKQVVQSFGVVTLEVTPKIAEKMQVAQSIGQMSLALRSIADTTAELERAVAAGEIEVPESDDPNAEKRMLLAIATQPIDTAPTVTVGGDVSRFQRRSMPPRPAPARPAAVAPAPQPQPYYLPSPTPAPRTPSEPVLTDRNSVRVVRGNNVTVVPVGAN